MNNRIKPNLYPNSYHNDRRSKAFEKDNTTILAESNLRFSFHK